MQWPHIVIYTDRLPAGVGGQANALLVRIREKYRNDRGIHEHEFEHVRQWWTVGIVAALIALLAAWLLPSPPAAVIEGWPWSLVAVALIATHPLLYYFVRPYRQWAEVLAYRQQTRYPDSRVGRLSIEDAAAKLMAPRYKLGLTTAQAIALLFG